MKSSGFGWEASPAVELLAASFLADDEFCASAELVAANPTNIRVITRNFFWFTGSFLRAKLELGASAARNCQQRELSSMHDSNRVTSCTPQPGAGLDLSPRALTAAEAEFREGQLAGQSPVARGVKCHVTWRVMEMQRAIGFLKKKKTFCSDCEQKAAIRAG